MYILIFVYMYDNTKYNIIILYIGVPNLPSSLNAFMLHSEQNLHIHISRWTKNHKQAVSARVFHHLPPTVVEIDFSFDSCTIEVTAFKLRRKNFRISWKFNAPFCYGRKHAKAESKTPCNSNSNIYIYTYSNHSERKFPKSTKIKPFGENTTISGEQREHQNGFFSFYVSSWWFESMVLGESPRPRPPSVAPQPLAVFLKFPDAISTTIPSTTPLLSTVFCTK